ncbi:hypothetical protein EDM52_09380 [Brevibacillus invocatus]|uniref:Uncharacterized protein n=1 Tax=Brevibacillus invocatus TaxID=173959 RepID=A0A3M8CHB7_9BACL|nr:hypothetical protein EDM52_09380 [Brevibacillus invocatus]
MGRAITAASGKHRAKGGMKVRWLTKSSLQNPAMVVLLSLLVALGGVFSFLVINIESEPQAKLGMLTVSPKRVYLV